MAKLSVAVLFGGRSGEHQVSLSSARSVLAVIDRSRYAIIPIGITPEGQWFTGEDPLTALSKGTTAGLTPVVLLPTAGDATLYAVRGSALQPLARLDVVFPVLHGTYGEDGTLQGLLELNDIAYVGAGVLASSVGMDKALFKEVMRANAVPVLPSLTFTRSEVSQVTESLLKQIEALAPYPLFTKPANLGSSVGITKCRSRADLLEGLMEAARFDRRILVERGLENPREIEISVLGNDDPQASLPGEIVPSDDFYSYKAKYIDGLSALMIPADLPQQVTTNLQQTAVRVYRSIDCSGMARVDFLMDRKTQAIFVSEVNTIPGFTSISMYPKLWEASGLSYAALIDRLIDLAMERKADRDRTERHFGSAS